MFEVGLILTVASLANLVTSFVSGRLTTRYGMQRLLVAVILLSAALVAVMPFVTMWVVLLTIMALVGATSGFFGQSVAWAADQIEEKTKGLGAKPQAKATGALGGVHSQVAKGMGFNRMVADISLVAGPLCRLLCVRVQRKHARLGNIVWRIGRANSGSRTFLAWQRQKGST